MTSQPSGELGHTEPSLMDIALEMDAQPGEPVENEEEDEQEEIEDAQDEGEEAELDDESEEEEESQPEDPEYEVDGAKVRLSELRAGYMKDADYRRKTSEVAETKRAVEGERQEIQQQRDYLAKQAGPLLHLMREQLIGSQQRLAQLAQEDPAAWVAENQAFQQRAQMFDALLAQGQQFEAQKKAEDERAHEEFVKSEREVLRQKLPEWNDPKVAATEQEKIGKYLMERGYSVEELRHLDHRDLLTARAAMQWHEHQQRVAEAKSKKGQPAVPERVVKPGASKPQATQQQKRIGAARQRLNNNPDDIRSLSGFLKESGF